MLSQWILKRLQRPRWSYLPRCTRSIPIAAFATRIGDTDLNLGAVADVNGTLYAFNGGKQEIVTLDLNGDTSPVRPFDSAAGIVTGATAVTPEPASIALAMIGGIGVAAILRRKRVRA